MFLFCFDCETFLIEPGGGAPPLVCFGWSKYDTETDKTESGILHHTDDVVGFLRAAFRETIEKNGRVVNHNIPFDFSVICHAHPDLIPDIFELYDRGIVEDTMIREQLFDIAKGTLKQAKHSLQALARKRLQVDMDKVTWRTGYDKLYDVPLADWPEGAKQYAIDDTQIAIDVYVDQRREMLEDDDSGEVPNSVEQARAHWALYLMTTWGIRTHAAKVSVFKRELEIRLAVFEKALKKVGFIRENGTKDLKAIREFLERVELPDGIELAKTEKGAVSTSAAAIDDLLDALGERLVPDKKKDGKLPVEWAMELAQKADKVHALELLAWHTSTQKLLSTYIPPLEQGGKYPINARYRPLVETGRASCSNPNLMNLPKEPGVRECYVPRPGFVFCSVDYEALELHTLAQACIQLVGESKLAEALNNKIDPHLALACEHLLEGVSYEEGKRVRKDEKHPRYKEVVHARNVAKCFHPDTEFLTKEGWKTFYELGDLEIAQARPENGEIEISWAKPFNKFSKKAEKLVHLKNEGIDIRVTDDHRMLAFNKNREPVVVTPLEFSKKRGFWNAGFLKTSSRVVGCEVLLRLAVATQADGSYTDRGNYIRFGFSKDRKKSRIRNLFDQAEEAGYSFSLTKREYSSEKMGDCTFWQLGGPLVVQIKELLCGKSFPEWWLDLPVHEREIILDEVRYWDAHTPPNGVAHSFASTDYRSVDVLQRLATITGRKTRLVLSAAQDEKRSACWKLTVRTKAHSRGGNVEASVEDYEGEVVCLSVPESFVIVRSGGVPVITGQCANFGLPGGLGITKLVAFCKASGIEITEEQAYDLKRAWLKQWPEMRKYFKHVSDLLEIDESSEDFEEFAAVSQLVSGRMRGKTRYTAACNSYFQGLAADLAKKACYDIAKACYVKGVNPILYGSRSVVFVHDEIIMEHPEETAHERAFEQARIMVEAGKPYCPDVPLKAEPALMRYWTKDATETYRDGRLVPWGEGA